jgi:thiol:disulfide interchange protein DsbG
MGQVSFSELPSKGLFKVKRFFCLFILSICSMLAVAQDIKLPAGVVQPGFFAKQGIKVLSFQKGVGGLNVWKVSRGDVNTVFYTSPDNQVLVSGVLWDAGSGSNLSDAYITADMKVQTTQAPQSTPSGNAVSVSQSDAIKTVASLTGIKEGTATPDKTLYIMFDPRCPHCHAVHVKTRAYVAGGGSIKWIPVAVLGDATGGTRLIADILQSANPVQALAQTMGKHTGGQAPKPGTVKTIAANEAYFFAAFDRNKGAGEAGVPVAFFETASGAPQMVSGVDDDQLLARIMKDIKK